MILVRLHCEETALLSLGCSHLKCSFLLLVLQNASLTKVQSNLAYKSVDKINEAIRRLESQLKSTNFRLSEEKKIVAEIDSLKRSKKALGSVVAYSWSNKPICYHKQAESLCFDAVPSLLAAVVAHVIILKLQAHFQKLKPTILD